MHLELKAHFAETSEYTLEIKDTEVRKKLQLMEKKTIRNWVIGGFSMGIVKGLLVSPLGQWSLNGPGELIL